METELQKTERLALIGDREAIVRLVSALRRYRELMVAVRDEYFEAGRRFWPHERVVREIEGESYGE